jgi:hypothetical protein
MPHGDQFLNLDTHEIAPREPECIYDAEQRLLGYGLHDRRHDGQLDAGFKKAEPGGGK